MTPIPSVRPQYVEYIPERLEPGVLYISKRFRTSAHLCCCGCGMKVVTPLNPAKWSLTDHGGSISLLPSIGNWGYPCRSHYLIIRNQVRWAGQMNQRQIAAVQRQDRKDVMRHTPGKGVLVRLVDALQRLFK